MKQIHLSILVAAGLGVGLIGAGCASDDAAARDVGDTHFIAFEGNQNEWPTADNALVDRDFQVPVYHGLPSKSYTIMGRIIGTQGSVIGRGLAKGLWSDRDRLQDVCAQANSRGADAVLLTNDATIMDAFQLNEGETGTMENPIYDFDGVVVAVKWTEGESGTE